MRLVRRAWKSAPAGAKAVVRRLKPKPPLIELTDTPGGHLPTWTIPAQVFQTGPTRWIHSDHHQAIQQFRDLNPQLEHAFLDEVETDRYMKTVWGNHAIFRVYERALFGQMKADIFRYCIVFERGGYYLDINKAIMQPLRALHSETDHALWSFEKNSAVVFPDSPAAWHLFHPEKLVLQWGFGFAPQHPILKLAIDRIVETSQYFGSKEFNRILPTVVMFTGPGVLTWAVRKYLSEHDSDGVAQHNPDFDETGITRLPQSSLAFQGAKHYSKYKHHRVLQAEPSDHDGSAS